MSLARYIRSLSKAEGYHPANHTGTLNQRLVSFDLVGSKNMEILHGTIEPGQGASMHAHPTLEQAAYILDGEAVVEMLGETARVKAGDCCYFPANTMHRITVAGDKPLKVLVIYSPPYGENPAEAVRG